MFLFPLSTDSKLLLSFKFYILTNLRNYRNLKALQRASLLSQKNSSPKPNSSIILFFCSGSQFLLPLGPYSIIYTDSCIFNFSISSSSLLGLLSTFKEQQQQQKQNKVQIPLDLINHLDYYAFCHLFTQKPKIKAETQGLLSTKSSFTLKTSVRLLSARLTVS